MSHLVGLRRAQDQGSGDTLAAADAQAPTVEKPAKKVNKNGARAHVEHCCRRMPDILAAAGYG